MFDPEVLSLFLAPVVLAFILAELIFSLFYHRKLYSGKDTLMNFYLMGLSLVLSLLFKTFDVLVFGYFYQYRFAEIYDPVIYWLCLLVIQDFLFYWLHYTDHYCRFFWAVHVTHHNSEHFNLTTGFRSSVLQPLYRFVYFIPLALLGFRPLDILAMFSLAQIWGIFVHTETVRKLPWLIEFIFVTPSHHRVHHASNIRYLDKNIGMFLIVWDRIFGTFQEELDNEPIQYGLTTKKEINNPFYVIFHEWLEILKDLKNKKTSVVKKLGYVFGPPGWSHDGSTKTSRQLQRELENETIAEDETTFSNKWVM